MGTRAREKRFEEMRRDLKTRVDNLGAVIQEVWTPDKVEREGAVGATVHLRQSRRGLPELVVRDRERVTTWPLDPTPLLARGKVAAKYVDLHIVAAIEEHVKSG